jgi:hypothetical protein
MDKKQQKEKIDKKITKEKTYTKVIIQKCRRICLSLEHTYKHTYKKARMCKKATAFISYFYPEQFSQKKSAPTHDMFLARPVLTGKKWTLILSFSTDRFDQNHAKIRNTYLAKPVIKTRSWAISSLFHPYGFNEWCEHECHVPRQSACNQCYRVLK